MSMHVTNSLADTLTEGEISVESLLERPWVTIVWDDPVNLMSYVTYVLVKVCGFSKEKAHDKMMQVHIEGRAVVATGSREEMEHYVQALHEHGLWATLQRDDKI